jgi:drug/metabolite transporter (DMT)-like permease
VFDIMTTVASPQTYALFLTLGATLSFSASSLVYAEYSSKVSVLWMNCFKSSIAFVLLLVTLPLFFGGWHHAEPIVVAELMLSGLLGLNIADLFLLKAFTKIGAARTLMLYGFQPVIIGIGANILFGQSLNPMKLIAVLFMIACLFTMSLENYRVHKKWALSGLLLALIAVTLDACGILITRTAFETTHVVTPVESHFYRCLGALVGFAIMSLFRPLPLVSGFLRWPQRQRLLLLAAAFGGTYLSLLLYLHAVKYGQLASLAGITITGPMFATTLECFIKRKPPSRYLLTAFGFFAIGFYVLIASP